LTSRLALCVLPALALASAAGCRGDTLYVGTDCLPSGSGASLTAAIEAQKTVLLCQRAEIILDAPVVLLQGLTLMTAGLPKDPTQMATIRLGPKYPTQGGPGVRGSGSDIHIQAVRFDGNRRVIGARDQQALVELGPGHGYTIEGSAFTDSAGWTHLHLIEPCDTSTVTHNLIESAARPHLDGGHWADGMSIACAHSLIAGNDIRDVSSNGIVFFGGAGTVIRDNEITDSTTSGWAGINVGDAIVPDNTGVIIENNHIVARGPRYFQQGIDAGLHVIGKTANIAGVTVRGNRIEGISRYGLIVDGCLDCIVHDNDVSTWHPLPPVASCPAPAPYVAAVTAGHASGDIQAGYVDAKADGCPGEPEVLGDIYRDYAGADSFPDYLAFEVQVYSQRLEQQLDAEALLRAEWDALQTRAKGMCPAGTASDLQTVWRRIAAAQYRDKLTAPAADAKVRADLTAASAGTPCSPPAP
jgi:hypothetical protein